MSRTRTYVAIGYPESLKPDWVDMLVDTHVPTIISPLHNMDTNPDGTIKKEHHHIMLCFDSVKTKEQAQEVFNSIGATMCQAVQSIRGQARYLCHLDNQEKAQYDVNDVICVNGADYISIIDLPSDKYNSIREMIQFVDEHKITMFCDLVRYAAESNDTWYRSLCDNSSYMMKEYIKSKSYKLDKEMTYDIRDLRERRGRY